MRHLLPGESCVATGDCTREAFKKFNNKTTLQTTGTLSTHIIRKSCAFFFLEIEVFYLFYPIVMILDHIC